MAQAQFKGQYSGAKYTIQMSLSLYVWEEEGAFFVYAPTLDLTGYGNSEKEAKKSFEITLEEFLEYTHNKNTMFDDLENLGWTVNRKKIKVRIPEFEDMINENEEFRQILTKPGYRKEDKNINLVIA